MKHVQVKNFKRKTNTIHSYRGLSNGYDTQPTVGETDPTNTVITILTTVSGQTHLAKQTQ
ncbi:hypothetical protein ABIB50_002084 [Mucilaginibacter sp. UYCu711]